MLKMIFVVEDVTISAARGDAKWNVDLRDNHSDESGTVELTDTEFGLMLLLTAGAGEDSQLSPELVKNAYEVLEPLFAEVDVRPFP